MVESEMKRDNIQKEKMLQERPPWYHRLIMKCAVFYWIIPVLGWWLWISGISFYYAVALLYLAGSFITFIFYWEDKTLAKHNWWRIREWTLHLWEILWGWPGALAAQRILRHKNRKIPYLCIFLLCVLLNIFLTWGIYRYGSDLNVSGKVERMR